MTTDTLKAAPIALFVYNRLHHTQQTVASLLQNALAKETNLFIFSDAAKNENTVEAVNAVREWLKTIEGFKSTHIVHQKSNLGLARSIIQGVTQIVNAHSKVIVMEDDLVVSPYFLDYMNDGLTMYENVPEVASIHGYALPLKESLPQTYFMRGADCWGWATWQRAWKHFEPDGSKLLQQLKQAKLEKVFNFDNTQANIQMLQDQIAGKNNSWAIRWHASAFLKNWVTLFPGKSLVNNIGHDQSGEHCVASDMFETTLTTSPIHLTPLQPIPSLDAYNAYVRFFKKNHQSLFKRAYRKLQRLCKMGSIQ